MNGPLVLSFVVFINVLSIFGSKAVETDDNVMILDVEHSFSNDKDPIFKKRGIINVKSLQAGNAHFAEENDLSTADMENLKKLVANDGFYRIQVTARNTKQSNTVSSFIRACSLYESKLSDILTLNMNQGNTLIGISLTTMQFQCNGLVHDDFPNKFNTSLIFMQSESGPIPDTQAYIQKLDREKDAKAKGEQPDNRSFFAKYWMYIVPVLIFLAISGASPDQGQGGGR